MSITVSNRIFPYKIKGYRVHDSEEVMYYDVLIIRIESEYLYLDSSP